MNLLTSLAMPHQAGTATPMRGQGCVIRDQAEHCGPLRVFNFDAHHDLGYEYPTKTLLGNFNATGNLHCDDWALIGLRKGWIGEYVLVYPDWLGKIEIKGKRIPKGATVLTWSEYVEQYPPGMEYAGSYVCRSSAWSPPMHDPAFTKFLDRSGYFDLPGLR